MTGSPSGVNGVVSSGVNYQRVAHIRNSALFETTKPRTVDVIRRDDSLDIYLDEVPFFSWSDNMGKTPTQDRYVSGKRRLILGGYQDNIVEYQKVELLPIGQ